MTFKAKGETQICLSNSHVYARSAKETFAFAKFVTAGVLGLGLVNGNNWDRRQTL